MNPMRHHPCHHPYPDVVYLFPYNGAYPFDANPSLAIDASSGLITGTPSSVGIFTLAICVSEYRNGVLIGNHRREMAEVYTVIQFPVGTNNPQANAEALILPVPASSELQIIPAVSEKN
jgi:hypothetical protein